jgi:AMP nucleosidase
MTDRNQAAVDTAIDQIRRRYEAAVGRLREAVADYVAKGTLPDPVVRSTGAFCYPELRIIYDGVESA